MDAPNRFDVFLKSTRVPLSSGLNFKDLRLGRIRAQPPQSHLQYPEALSDFLLLTAGLVRRKLALNWTVRGRKTATDLRPIYSRGTASGGGLYPLNVYLVLRSRIGVPGVYGYDVGHHSLTRIRLAHLESLITTALEWTASPDLWFIITARFWRTIFKYHSLSYQIITQDVGALLGSMEQVAYSLGWTAKVFYWFHDQAVARLLRLELETEAPFAVLSVKQGASENDAGDNQAAPSADDSLRNGYHCRIYEQSQKRPMPAMLRRIHEATLLNEVRRPYSRISKWKLLTPMTDRACIDANLCSILKDRETSWGLFRSEPAIQLSTLKKLFDFVACGVRYQTDLYKQHVVLPTVRFSLIAQYVNGLRAGAYDFSSSRSEFSLCSTQPDPMSMQGLYFLANHNLDQVGAILVVIGRIELVLQSLGPRGIRVLNAEAGIAAQRAYMASTALSLGCGAILGFDGRKIDQILGLTKEEMPLLLILLGSRCANAFAYDFPLV
jgi:SagB-type dehydrogenase family enzyme